MQTISRLLKVIENATHKSFKQNLNELIIKKVHLKYTARYDSNNHQQYMVKGYKLKIISTNISIQQLSINTMVLEIYTYLQMIWQSLLINSE